MPLDRLLQGAAIVSTIGAQLFAVMLAFRLMRRAGRFRLAWGAIALALTLMMVRRSSDLASLGRGEGTPAPLVLFTLGVSLLFAWGMLGVSELFSELERTRAELYEEATRDELTHLSNRRHALLMARHEAERARRSGRPLTFLLLDIDHFKKVNDTLGHEAGDEVLRRVTAACAKELRASDIFGRIGGDEFLVVLPEQGNDAARLVAERLRSVVEAQRGGAREPSWGLSISIGFASFDRVEMAAEELVMAALARADDALYRAKQEGRNRVVQATVLTRQEA